MRLTESCPCGATLTVESNYCSEVRIGHKAFLDVHEPCRRASVRTLQPVSSHTAIGLSSLAEATVYPDRTFTTHVYNPAPAPGSEGTAAPCCCDRHHKNFDCTGLLRCCPKCPITPAAS